MSSKNSAPAEQPAAPSQYEVHKLIGDVLRDIPHEIPEELLNNETFLREVAQEVALLLRRRQTAEALEVTHQYHLEAHQDILHEDTIHYYAVQAANHLAGGSFEQQQYHDKLITAFGLKKGEVI